STLVVYSLFCTFLFNDTAPTERYTLSLHDALPIFAEHLEELMVACCIANVFEVIVFAARTYATLRRRGAGIRPRFRAREDILELDRKSTRLNSSHVKISYAVFCLKKKKKSKQDKNK